MRWLVTRVVVVSVAMIALIGGVVTYRRAQADPNPLHAYRLDVCDGRPCFTGITPGVTSWGDAQLMAGKQAENILGGAQFAVSVRDSDFLVETVDFRRVTSIFTESQAADFPPVGDFVAQYGIPCRVLIDRGTGRLELRYPLLSILVNIHSADRLTPDAPVDLVVLVDPALEPDYARDLCTGQVIDMHSERWSGFTSFDLARWYP